MARKFGCISKLPAEMSKGGGWAVKAVANMVLEIMKLLQRWSRAVAAQ